MRVIELGDAGSFLKHSHSLLLKSEADNQLLLSSALTLARTTAGRSPRLSFFVVANNNTSEAAALNVTDRRLLLSASSESAARFLGQSLATQYPSLTCIMGPTSAAQAFSEGFTEKSSIPFAIHQKQLILRLTNLRPYQPATGMWRAAKDKDTKLLIDWSCRFVDECRLDESQEETEEVVRRYIEGRQLFIWEDPYPVAMTGFGGITPSGVRVNMVYTDPKARSRGYGTSLVAAVSRKLLTSGEHKHCFLLVDATNTTAIHVYERLGYQQVSESLEMRRRPLQWVPQRAPQRDPVSR